MSKARDPKTPAEWQDALDCATFLISLDDCRLYGLIEGGPGVNRERCIEIIERAKKGGLKPAPFEDLMRKYL